MKKLLIILLSSLMLMLTSCSGVISESAPPDAAASSDVTEEASSAAPSEAPEAEPTGTGEPVSGSNILVVYFSRVGEQYGVGVIEKGNTEIVAETIAEKTGADIFEIVPADDRYPMTYDELTDVAKREQNENARPEYAGGIEALGEYDTIFIGAPVWWGDWPMIMYTFFENNDLSGKTLYPFSTHAGSGLSGFDKKLAAACPDSEVGDGLAIRGSDAQNDPDGVRTQVEDWIDGLKLST